MKMTEARDILFKDFIEWIKEKKGATPERFSMEIWASRIFDLWYGEYAEERKKQQLGIDVLKIFSAQEIENILHRKKIIDIRKRQEAQAIELQRHRETEAAKSAPKADNDSAVVEEKPAEEDEGPYPTEEEMKAAAEATQGITDIPQDPSKPEPVVVKFPKKKGLFGFLKK